MEGSCSPRYYGVTVSRPFTTAQEDIKFICVHLRLSTTRFPALRPSGCTYVHSKCSRHFSVEKTFLFVCPFMAEGSQSEEF